MAEAIYSPNITRSPRFQTYMNQYAATSGRVPSARMLDEIIQGELDAASNNMYRNKTLQLQKDSLEEQRRQFNIGQENAVDTASANRNSGLITTAVNAATTYGMYKALKAPNTGGGGVPKISATGQTPATPLESYNGVPGDNRWNPYPNKPGTTNIVNAEAYPEPTGPTQPYQYEPGPNYPTGDVGPTIQAQPTIEPYQWEPGPYPSEGITPPGGYDAGYTPPNMGYDPGYVGPEFQIGQSNVGPTVQAQGLNFAETAPMVETPTISAPTTISVTGAGEATTAGATTLGATPGAVEGAAYGADVAGMGGITAAEDAALMESANMGAASTYGATSTGATAGSALSTVGVAAGYAAAAIAAAKIGMPILGDLLGAQDEEEYQKDPSSNVMTQAANITAYEWDRPIEAGAEVLGLPMPSKGTLGAALINPGSYLLDKLGCIIVTACTSRDSAEVNITRKYRDAHMDNMELRGYYIIAEKIVPLMYKYPDFKRFVKKYLVDGIVDYCEYANGDRKTLPRPWSAFVMKTFLGLCGYVGSRRSSFVRCNGEIF